ncbi:hypothetical protein GCM10027360_27460 [Amycolatopsis echigonensis]
MPCVQQFRTRSRGSLGRDRIGVLVEHGREFLPCADGEEDVRIGCREMRDLVADRAAWLPAPPLSASIRLKYSWRIDACRPRV